jgi:hypothetical protein
MGSYNKHIMAEIAEGQQPSPVEQGTAHPLVKESMPENVQVQSSVDRPITSVDMLEKGDIIGRWREIKYQ